MFLIFVINKATNVIGITVDKLIIYVIVSSRASNMYNALLRLIVQTNNGYPNLSDNDRPFCLY